MYTCSPLSPHYQEMHTIREIIYTHQENVKNIIFLIIYYNYIYTHYTHNIVILIFAILHVYYYNFSKINNLKSYYMHDSSFYFARTRNSSSEHYPQQRSEPSLRPVRHP